MKTLIFNGSPEKDGETAELINQLRIGLVGEKKIVNAYFCRIRPCMDCRWCWKNSGCCKHDEMMQVYDYIQVCDNILIISPVYFSGLSAQLLSVSSRLQTYFSARFFRGEDPIKKPKKGAVILLGNKETENAAETAYNFLRHMNCKNIQPAICGQEISALLGEAKRVELFFNGEKRKDSKWSH